MQARSEVSRRAAKVEGGGLGLLVEGILYYFGGTTEKTDNARKIFKFPSVLRTNLQENRRKLSSLDHFDSIVLCYANLWRENC